MSDVILCFSLPVNKVATNETRIVVRKLMKLSQVLDRVKRVGGAWLKDQQKTITVH